MRPEIEVGVVGLGNVGGDIARNLARAGHATAGWDISQEARADRGRDRRPGCAA